MSKPLTAIDLEVGQCTFKGMGAVQSQEVEHLPGGESQVKDQITNRISSISPLATVDEASYLMQRMNLVGLAVFDGRRFMGIVAMSDLLDFLHRQDCDPYSVLVREVVRQPYPTCAPDEPVDRVCALMHKLGIAWIPVLEPSGKLAGVFFSRPTPG